MLRHVHFQYVCNIHVKYYKITLKVVRGVEFTKYALLTIIHYVQWWIFGYVKNAVGLSKNSSLKLHIIILNMSVTYMQCI